jgi:electron transfer flavoprotein beta subunit
MAAKKAVIPTWGVEEIEADESKIGLKASPTKVTKVFSPPVKTDRELISGDNPTEMIAELIHKMKERKIL